MSLMAVESGGLNSSFPVLVQHSKLCYHNGSSWNILTCIQKFPGITLCMYFVSLLLTQIFLIHEVDKCTRRFGNVFGPKEKSPTNPTRHENMHAHTCFSFAFKTTKKRVSVFFLFKKFILWELPFLKRHCTNVHV